MLNDMPLYLPNYRYVLGGNDGGESSVAVENVVSGGGVKEVADAHDLFDLTKPLGISYIAEIIIPKSAKMESSLSTSQTGFRLWLNVLLMANEFGGNYPCMPMF